ncbi:Hypothetical protein GLP15_4206 [Giardia lamblia P15]|uniref:Uncharacterized protein n=1 Tax=Giardia intestinalis (strain P15) TaxID=658858 RepID=E1F0K5_GIAIA|nr:Hypothetical protein GLP15_4206 [Giardia lamblia P15]
MQSERSRANYHTGQNIPLTREHDSYKMDHCPIPVKAKIHGAELIAKEKIHINWDDSNFDNYFYDDNDDSRNVCDNTASESPARTISVPKYTVIYSTGTTISSVRNSIDEPGVDLQNRTIAKEQNRVDSNSLSKVTSETIIQEHTTVPRAMGPRQFSHKGAPMASVSRVDYLPEKGFIQNTVPHDAVSHDSYADSMPVASSEVEYKPEPFPKERHCLSRGSRSSSSCADTERSSSPIKQQPQAAYQSTLCIPEHPAKNTSALNQPYLPGSPNTSFREIKPSAVEAAYHRNSAGITQRPHPVTSNSPPHPTPATITAPTLTHQQPHGQGHYNVQAPKQAYITTFRNSLSTNMSLTNDKPSSSRSPHRIFNREKKPGVSEPLTTNKARIPQPYQHPPQPIPQQYPTDGSLLNIHNDQIQSRAISERSTPRRSLASTTNINAIKLQDAVRQADELHSHALKQSYTKRSTLDDPYSETLARAEAILSPKRVIPTIHGGACSNPPILPAKVEPNSGSAMPQIVDINNRIKEAMTISRNALSSQQSDNSARNSVSSPIRGVSPTNPAYASAPTFASPISPAGRRQAFPAPEGVSPSLQLAKKYIDVAGVARVNYERTISPSRIAMDSSGRSSMHHYPLSRTSNSRPSIDETEAANYLTSRIAMQQDGKRVPSTQNLTIKAPSPSRGRQYNPLY